MALLELLRSLIEALHSDGTPGQVAAGLAFCSILGPTPLVNRHNAAVCHGRARSVVCALGLTRGILLPGGE